MYSQLRPSLLYTDISPDIAEHDEDHDASEWSYTDKTVFRGALDGSYKDHGLDVYWLYDDNLLRIGLAEHESDNHSVFKTLWFRETPFGTLLQEDWTTNGTLWDMVTPEAYQDSLDSDFKNVMLLGGGRLVTPENLIKGFPDIYECSCGLSFSPRTGCASVKKTVTVTSPIFIDSSFIVYVPPVDSIVWSKLGLQHDACVQEQEQTQILTPLLEAPSELTPA
jgi:hypothetical protein